LFSDKSFIQASRDFVCVRLESYENEEHQQLIRKLLNGRLANTAFVIFSPDGKTPLTRSGRSPHHGLNAQAPFLEKSIDNSQLITNMKTIAAKYPSKGEHHTPVMQDFHSFGQALRIASADQRLLVYVKGSASETAHAKKQLAPFFSHRSSVGRYHWDFSDKKDTDWQKAVQDSSDASGIYIIRAGTYGLNGAVMAALPLNSELNTIAKTLTQANATFAQSEKRKVYSQHVTNGRRKGINFQNKMPYGEDRDGNGEID